MVIPVTSVAASRLLPVNGYCIPPLTLGWVNDGALWPAERQAERRDIVVRVIEGVVVCYVASSSGTHPVN